MKPYAAARVTTGLLAAACVAACQPPIVGPRAQTSQPTPVSLTEPDAYDWSTSRVTSRIVAERQAAHFRRRVLAYPDSSPAWAGGLGLAGFGCDVADTAPNGPAVAFPATGALVNKLFFLTRAGVLIKLDRLTPTNYDRLDLGRTCSRTSVTMSPYSTRVYLLADDGTFAVVDATTMQILATASVPGGFGTAPVVDRGASAPDDSRDVVYVPANDGSVHSFVVTRNAEDAGVQLAAPTVHAVATQVAPLAGTRRIAAPALALDGMLYVGDQAGNFHVYDTADPTRSFIYAVGAPVTTPPALVLQDGSYEVTDADGNPKPVGYGEPVYAFVSAGAACAWIDLHDTTTTYSQALRIDDNDPTRTFGYLRDYAFSTAGSTQTWAAADGGNVNTEAPDRPLPGYAPNIWSNDFLVPAGTNTTETAGAAAGGPVKSFLRFQPAGAAAVGGVVAKATLTLTAAVDQACRPARIKPASSFFRGTAERWASDRLTNANRPAVGPAEAGTYLSGGVSAAGNVTFKKQRAYQWDVTKAFTSASTDYALALDYDAYGDAVLWPEGPVGGATGKKAKKAHQVEAIKFVNNPLNANGSPAIARDERPVLELTISSTAMPAASIETAPVVDPVTRRVYVFYTNALYALDFSSPEAWSDTDPTGQPHTLFNVAYHGALANGGGTHDGKKRFVSNMTDPLLSHDRTAAYVLDRYPAVDGSAPTTWNYAVSKIALPLSPTGDRRVPGTAAIAGVPGDASVSMLLDPLNKLRTGGNVYLGLGDGKLYQVDP